MSNPNTITQVQPDRPAEQAARPMEEAALCPAFPAWKRVLDVGLVLLALPFLLPVGLVLFAFIKIVSPGPAFFRQQRVGYQRRKFMCLKFRTMKVNADTGVHQDHLRRLMTTNQPTQKLDVAGDKRLIVGGMWLRAAGVDELPQLFNVLRGEMSLVGPRPCTPYEFELYTEAQKQRCLAPPGLTGLWQISGKNRTTFMEMMDLDLKYVGQMSPGQDLKIIVLTTPAILKLVWEMKIRPRITLSARDRNAQPAQEFPAKAAGPLTGTVPARD